MCLVKSIVKRESAQRGGRERKRRLVISFAFENAMTVVLTQQKTTMNHTVRINLYYVSTEKQKIVFPYFFSSLTRLVALFQIATSSKKETRSSTMAVYNSSVGLNQVGRIARVNVPQTSQQRTARSSV